MNEAFIMNESTKVAKKERIDVLCPIGFMSMRETRWGISSHVLRSETTLLIRELLGSEYIKSKEPNVQKCLKRTVATVVAE